MDYQRMTAPCGLDCFNCQMFLASENDELRLKISQKSGISFAQAICQGCRDEGGSPDFLKRTEPCSVYQCITQKDLDFCSKCSDFPCDYLQPYADRASEVPHNTKVFNLCLIKKMGLEAWAKTKAKNVKHAYFSEKFRL
ncbi:MAG: DUF3795 domain-containing protein [Dehalococcoidales bacterium]|nr:DUF3795 domain-containing protein [Dehalococcoidales bacterium]